jgi:tripartite-type tricarboxylate transporter receptor subunit TctC
MPHCSGSPQLPRRTGHRRRSAYPSQAIRLLVPFTAGSGTDVIARAVGDQLRNGFKQTVIVDNKPGAGGTLGASQVASAPADGYTVLVHSAGHVANAALFPQLRYDTLKDFTPGHDAGCAAECSGHAPGRYKNVQELVAKARASGQAMYASAGNGSATHMNAEKFLAAVGVAATHVPFRGTPEALTEVMAGRLDWFFAPLVSALPLIKAGKLDALGVGTPRRSPALPDVPTTLELGYAGSGLYVLGRHVRARQDPGPGGCAAARRDGECPALGRPP